MWKKRDSLNTIEEIVKRNTGFSLAELDEDREYLIEGLSEAHQAIEQAIRQNEQITIIGDYDADGITGSSILFLLLQAMGVTARVRIPKRMTEGYGLSPKIIEEIESGLIITIDNGINANEAIEQAKKKGLKVIVIDHHLPTGELPSADIIIDPHITPADFENYCGAGLAYKLSKYILEGKNDRLLEKLCSLAAIGTIADVVPLLKDNRVIVKEGLKNINAGITTSGIKKLFEIINVSRVTEEDIGYYVAPMINSAGRLYDNGASFVFRLIASENTTSTKLHENMSKLKDINEKRKQLVNQALEEVSQRIESGEIVVDNNICAYIPGISEGIVGIIAGKLCEENGIPVIIFTDSGGDYLKGSGRSPSNIHLKNLLDGASKYLLKYGGHAGAAGLSISNENLIPFKTAISQLLTEQGAKNFGEGEQEEYYDIDIDAKDVDKFHTEIQQYAPFGEGNPRPVIKVNNFRAKKVYENHYRFMGNDANHVRIFGEINNVVGFSKAEMYRLLDCPSEFNMIARITENTFRDVTTVQLEIVDFC